MSPGSPKLVFYTHDSISFLWISSSVPCFKDSACKRYHSHPSVSHLLHAVWQSLGASMLLQMALFCYFFDWVIFHCIYVPHSLYPFLCWWTHLGCLHVLAIVNSAAMNIRKHISFKIMVFLLVYAQEWVAGSYGRAVVVFFFLLHQKIETINICQ